LWLLEVSTLVGGEGVMASLSAGCHGRGGVTVERVNFNIAQVPCGTHHHDSQQDHHVPVEL
jgi:hypothetical protein